jgi:hypothetical protein
MIGVLIEDTDREFLQCRGLTCHEAAFQLFKRSVEIVMGSSGRDRRLSAEDAIPWGLLDGRCYHRRFLDPFDGCGEASVILEGSDEIGSIKVCCLHGAEEEGLKDGIPILADEGALGQGMSVEEEGNGENDLGDGECIGEWFDLPRSGIWVGMCCVRGARGGRWGLCGSGGSARFLVLVLGGGEELAV